MDLLQPNIFDISLIFGGGASDRPGGATDGPGGATDRPGGAKGYRS